MASFTVTLPESGAEATLNVGSEGVTIGGEALGYEDIYRIKPAVDLKEVALEMNSGATVTVNSADGEEICAAIRERLTERQPSPSVYRKGVLQPLEMLKVLTENGWLRYLELEYKFRSGDEIPVDVVGKEENDKFLKLKLQETGGGDLVLKGRGSPVSFRAGELCLCLCRRLCFCRCLRLCLCL